ncbi:large-conductance mechanosensitive channel protein MscL [Legionella erythra]|uniref:Large-conductance mechanosensitive channel n=1 Tax=Legionella erythra TaxID=448 RepID=A0A0W0TWJ6_LEGER|nr:large-conductance mechanosensitive channel protein MscL [Legionella erythra]KTD00030.1 large conductance mechanosensitive channel [Legionella erythra]
MGFFTEFKQFAMRGNVVDLAVAVVIGAAFGKIVSSLVDGIVMPLIGLLLGGINVANKSFQIGDAVVKWGAFLQTVIDFTLIAFAIFVVIKLINLLQQKQDEAPEKLSREAAILIEIRDLLSRKDTHSSD